MLIAETYETESCFFFWFLFEINCLVFTSMCGYIYCMSITALACTAIAQLKKEGSKSHRLFSTFSAQPKRISFAVSQQQAPINRMRPILVEFRNDVPFNRE